jgi:hypothetical protein
VLGLKTFLTLRVVGIMLRIGMTFEVLNVGLTVGNPCFQALNNLTSLLCGPTPLIRFGPSSLGGLVLLLDICTGGFINALQLLRLALQLLASTLPFLQRTIPFLLSAPSQLDVAFVLLAVDRLCRLFIEKLSLSLGSLVVFNGYHDLFTPLNLFLSESPRLVELSSALV